MRFQEKSIWNLSDYQYSITDISFLLAALDTHCCMGLFLVAEGEGDSPVAVCWLLSEVASLPEEHGHQAEVQ